MVVDGDEVGRVSWDVKRGSEHWDHVSPRDALGERCPIYVTGKRVVLGTVLSQRSSHNPDPGCWADRRPTAIACARGSAVHWLASSHLRLSKKSGGWNERRCTALI